MKRKIILASSSPRRIELLKSLGLEFEVVNSGFDERTAQNNLRCLRLYPGELSMSLARGKVDKLSNNYRDEIIIGADTFVCVGGGNCYRVYGKPENEEDKE